MKPDGPRELQQTITLFGAVALAVGIVVGAGMLALPGLVHQRAGGMAIWSWVADAVLVAPLLVVFAGLGRRFPSAGGVAGFVAAAFPWAGVGASYVVFGAFALGGPAIALTGAGYILQAFGTGVGVWTTVATAALLLGGALAAAWNGSKVAGTVQNLTVTLLVLCLVATILASAGRWGDIDFTAGAPTVGDIWQGAALAFFAYTGWEMLAFAAEEFKNPRRDFPIAVALGFVTVTALYVGVALAVQALVPLDDPRLASAPFLVVVEASIGGPHAVAAVAVLAAVIILANLNGLAWAASRLLYDAGRRGWAPGGLGLQTLSGKSATPRTAIVCLGVIFTLVLLGYGAGLLSLETLLRTAGQNFFLLYVACILVHLALGRGIAARVFGVAALAACLVFAGAFGWGLLYAAALFAAPYMLRTISFGPDGRARRDAPARTPNQKLKTGRDGRTG